MTGSELHTGSVSPPRGRHYWERFAGSELPDGADLADLRRGIGKSPGAVPEMWRFYTTLTPDGGVTSGLVAEHLALTLFAVHQQSRPRLVHLKGVGLGTAILALRTSGKFSEQAVDRRFGAAATATSVAEVGIHLRGLVTQLRPMDQPIDYTQLMFDLRGWQNPEWLSRVRRRWGSQYFAPRAVAAGVPGAAQQTDTSN